MKVAGGIGRKYSRLSNL